MKKLILLLLFCFILAGVSAQNDSVFDNSTYTQFQLNKFRKQQLTGHYVSLTGSAGSLIVLSFTSLSPQVQIAVSAVAVGIVFTGYFISLNSYKYLKFTDLNQENLIRLSNFHTDIAVKQISNNRHAKAKRNLNHAIQIDPDNYLAYYFLGISYYNKNEFFYSIDYFKESIKRKNDFADAYHYLGLANSKVGFNNSACEAFKKAVQLGGTSSLEFLKDCK